MAERDPEFQQDVLSILYAALSNREALAAAMSGQAPAPVPDAAPPAPDAPASPLDTGIQGGAPVPVPPARPFLCGHIIHVDYEDLAFDDTSETHVGELQGGAPGSTREQIVQELMRRALKAEIQGLADDLEVILS